VAAISANDGAVALAGAASGSVEQFVAAMNDNARQLGMRDSRFGTPNGWPDEGRTFTSARDLAILGRAIVTQHPAKYRNYIGREGMTFHGIAQANHDPITGVVRGADGIKTGFTREAGYGFLGSALRDDRRLIMVVAGSPTGSERRRAARDLIEWGYAAFDTRILFYKNETIGSAQVQGGASGTVSLVAPRPLSVSLPKRDAGTIALDIVYPGPIDAPIAKGDPVATLRVTIKGEEPFRLPLVAGETVEEAGPFRRIVNGFAGLFS
jgi:D-alanyl-D-alanine carboxypeptidase (penicillin-binding protein 5/6)